ncbi:MAG: hypothetical protein HW421_4048 [Ignavibacteria bacterium]|nr:hypothetical protein [Ignavibacteria bacterium]
MFETAFFEFPELTSSSNDCYSIIGRALFYATFFESNFVAFNKGIELKINFNKGLTFDDPNFKNILAEISKRSLYKHINFFKNRFDKSVLPDILIKDFYQILNDARESRNIIAHDICKGIEFEIETDKGHDNICQQIKENILKIAKADAIVCFFIQIFNQEPVPVSSYIEDYPIKVMNWVLGQ